MNLRFSNYKKVTIISNKHIRNDGLGADGMSLCIDFVPVKVSRSLYSAPCETVLSKINPEKKLFFKVLAFFF